MLSQRTGLVSLLHLVGSGSPDVESYYEKLQKVGLLRHKNGKAVQISSNLLDLTLA